MPLAVLALHGQIDGIEPTLAGRLQGVAADPVGGSIGLDVLGGRRARDGIPDPVPIKHAEHGINAGSPLEHLGAMPLHEASGDDDPLQLAAFLASDRFVDHVQRFIARRLEKTAGIDDDRIGLLVVGDKFVAALGEFAEHRFRVDEVLRTAEADEGDALDGGGRHR